MKTVVLAVGSNMGNKLENIALARDMLSRSCDILCSSSIYETPPAFFEHHDNFYNCALAVSTDVDAFELLKLCKGIESALGRKPSFRNAPRPIDLDIIFYGDERVDTDVLKIPHIDWQNRDFVITPLLDLCNKGVFDASYFVEIKSFLSNKTRAFKKITDL